MEKYGIPSPKGAVFTDFQLASDMQPRLVDVVRLKADGLALGKGVIVSKDMEVT